MESNSEVDERREVLINQITYFQAIYEFLNYFSFFIAIGLGSCLFWSRTAHLIGIHISSLEVENTYNVPLAIYGFLSVIGGFLTSFLPANNHRPLPNVAIEVEKSMILEDSTRRKRNRLLNTPCPRMLDSIDVDILHFDEEQENERNNNLLELSVRERL
ncbi:UNVERIFIED_CONTAM: hypothetical protein NCL1_12846 [Trichonephila clavipes]